jgi:hypothetical protein
LANYIEEIDKILNKEIIDIDSEIEKHIVKISFFQHERLIHLLVTLAYGLLGIISFAVATITPLFVVIGIIFFLFLIPYVFHYFFLENGVQYLYVQYDKLLEKKNI